tara:strand:+ start:120 stop:1034 length:915 start_codon:yes stop_codon:yes gene_type:complete
MKKLIGIILLTCLCSNISIAQEKCFDYIDFSWRYLANDGVKTISKEDNPGWAEFNFKNTSNKTITITHIYLMTSNREEVVKTGRNLIIGPYGKDKTVMFSLNSINLDVVGGGTFACKFGKVSKTPDMTNQANKDNTSSGSKKMSWSATSDSSLTWLPALIAGIIIAVVVPLLLNSKQNPFKNKRNIRNVTSKKNNDRNKNSNIVEIVWAGEETMSKTFWIYCILTVAIVSFLSGLALTFLGNIMWLIPVSVIIWSNTGLWRSSNFYQNEKLKNKQSYGWATAAKVYVVLNYITTLSQIGLSLNV